MRLMLTQLTLEVGFEAEGANVFHRWQRQSRLTAPPRYAEERLF